LRSLGVGVVRVTLPWDQIAPAAQSRTRPAGFNATDPAAYPATNWAPYDTIVREAQADGIRVDFVVTGSVRGGAPDWAGGQGAPRGVHAGLWKPSGPAYGQFVQAVATRYRGSYTPSGASQPLPRVSFWEFWNEPNWGLQLTPQTLNGGRPVAPNVYRQLVNYGWKALSRTGHAHDTMLVGNLAPLGRNNPGLIGFIKPLAFLRTLYCVDSSYRPLRGTGAQAVGCPTTTRASRRFRTLNPGLFNGVQFGMHPYPYGSGSPKDPDNITPTGVPRLAKALNKVQRAYGSGRQLPIYNTEFGYITSPPARPGTYPSPDVAARSLNSYEYFTYRNPRMASTMQYLLYDTPQAISGFFTGLILQSGQPKATFSAYRMPIWLPVTKTRNGGTLEVWGCVRPAHFAAADTGQPQTAWVQYRSSASAQFTTLQGVRITNPHGYIDLRVKFPASGQVRLAWQYPAGDTALLDPVDGNQWVYSRVTNITIQ